jgi:alpha-galactosidase/6-phospho-beta-glucosidase family protein
VITYLSNFDTPKVRCIKKKKKKEKEKEMKKKMDMKRIEKENREQALDLIREIERKEERYGYIVEIGKNGELIYA